MSVPEFLARGPPACAPRCLRPLAQAAGRGQVLPAGATCDRGEVVAPHEAEARAKAGHGLPPGEGRGVMGLGRLDARAGSGSPQRLVRGAQGQVDRDGLVDCRGGTALGDALPVGGGGEWLAELGQVILAVGIVPGG
jgi:hypothetical protein